MTWTQKCAVLQDKNILNELIMMYTNNLLSPVYNIISEYHQTWRLVLWINNNLK
jgi:hypothetical protein